MGQIGKSQFLALKFDRFDALETRSQEREQDADEITRNVENPMGEGEFTGAAGDAARVKCEVITGSMKKQSSLEQDGARAAREAGSLLQAHKDLVVAVVDDIENIRPFVITYKDIHKRFGYAKVSEDWKIIPPPVQIPDAPPDAVRAAVDAIVKIDQDDLDARLKAFVDEDEAQARKIAQATAFDQVASGDPLIGETPEEAKKAADDVLNGTATQEEKDQVAAATDLKDKLEALKNGDSVSLGPEAWAVVYQMQRAMDGKSPEQIKRADQSGVGQAPERPEGSFPKSASARQQS